MNTLSNWSGSVDEDALLDHHMDEICLGLAEGVAREVQALRREGYPIYVELDGKIVDLQSEARDTRTS